MPVSFNQIPANIRVPLFYVETDPSRAGTGALDQRVLIFGHPVGGTAAPNVPIQVGSVEQAKVLFGAGSMLTQSITAFRAGNTASEVWACPVAEPGSGSAAAGAIEVAATDAKAGTTSLYLTGRRVQIGVSAGDSADTIAAAIHAAAGADADHPFTSAVSTNTVTLTSRWKGLTGNDLHIGHSLRGVIGGEALPDGVTLSITQPTGGTGAPDLASAIAALGDTPFEHVVWPWTDTASLDAIVAEYGFGDAGRWGWRRQLYGHVWSAKRATQANLTTFGNARNDGIVSILGHPTTRPTPDYEIAAAYAAQAARALLNDPARPLQTLALAGVMSEPEEDRFTWQQRNTLLYDGIATSYVDEAGTVRIEREATTHQRNDFGQSDDAFLDATTLSTLARLFRAMRSVVTSKYPRHKLADNGTRFGPGQAIVTPNVIKAEMIAEYRRQEFLGLVENTEEFIANLIVERDATDPTRLNVLYPPDLVNALRVFAVLGQFRLQYDRAAA